MAAAKCMDPCTSSSNSPPMENFVFNYKTIKPLDDALRCSICFEYFTNCMMTKCSHNYCSVCIRRYMTYKSQCPTCFQDASEPELRNNRLIDEILQVYKKLRGLDDENSTSITDARSDYVQEEMDSSSQSTSKMCSQSSSSNKPSTPCIKIEVPMDKSLRDRLRSKKELDFNKVTCPVCYTYVFADRINTHLDTCLRQQFQEEPEVRKMLPKLVYHLLTDKEIKVKLKEHGLNVCGDRQTLIRRHKNFVTLHNANCDSLNPKPISEIVKEIELQEVEERINSLEKQIQVHKKSDQGLIEQHHQAYIERHQSQFNALINDIHCRQMSELRIKEEKEDPFIESYGEIRIKEEKEDPYFESYERQTNIILNQDNITNEETGRENYSLQGERHSKEDDLDDSDSTSSEDLDIRKITTNVHRKRKKATVSIVDQDSPQKK